MQKKIVTCMIIFSVAIVFSQVTPDLTSKQRYLNGAVSNSTRPYRGINVTPVWEMGYNGSGIHVADVQYDWDLTHEDLIDKNIEAHFDDIDAGQQQHGTNAIGIIGAVKNDFGMTGIAYGCDMSVWDIYSEMLGQVSWGRAIRAAADQLNRGDIIELEISLVAPGTNTPVPAEIHSDLHSAIKYAVGKGMVVLQAAGNGNSNLDNITDMPNDDNGSIMVGNGSLMQVRMKTSANSAVAGSNYGKRVNVQAWGDTVVATLGTWSWSGITPIKGFHGETFGNDDHRAYCYQFSGTSSALPIVSGVCAVIQSFAKDSLKRTLSSSEMRELLIASGHPQDTSEVSGHIGPIPDVYRAIKYLTGDTIETAILNNIDYSTKNSFKISKNLILEIPVSIKGKIDIKIVNIAGREVKRVVATSRKKINLNSLNISKGFYIVQVSNGNNISRLKWFAK